MLLYSDDRIKVYAAVADTSGISPGRHNDLAMQRHKVGHLLAEAFPGLDPVIRHLPSGAPQLEGVVGEWSISVTHCRGLVALAVTQYAAAIGIDADMTSRGHQLRRVAPRFLSPSQHLQWGSGDGRLLLAWSIKEALYKAAGIAGLPLRDIPLPDAEMFCRCGRARVTLRGSEYEVMIMPEIEGCGPVIVALGGI